MYTIANWLDESYIITDYFWVGSLDQDGDDGIKWASSGESMSVIFLAEGQPDHGYGNNDCGYLHRNNINRMALAECDVTLYGAVCQVDIIN